MMKVIFNFGEDEWDIWDLLGAFVAFSSWCFVQKKSILSYFLVDDLSLLGENIEKVLIGLILS